MIRKVLLWPDMRLREVSKPVTEFGGELLELQQDLIDTCAYHQGAGLAAIQVGVPLRGCVVMVATQLVGMWNPTWTEVGALEEQLEGCLSFPGVYAPIERHAVVQVSYQDALGAPQTLKLYGIAAQALQHECEHLDGRVLPDNLDSVHKASFLQRYKIHRRRVKKG